ncbi:hypothetical protein BH10CYA1_BH10CYA1_03190 [soil metagenome]
MLLYQIHTHNQLSIERAAPQQCYKFLNIVCQLLQSGVVAAKCESSGIAHSRRRWIELFESCAHDTSIAANLEVSKLGNDFWTSLFHAYVQLPIDSSEEYLFSSFCLYLLDECPPGQFLSGNTFQPDLDFPSFRVIWEPCRDLSDHDLYFNPYGRWRFTTAGKNSKLLSQVN